MVSNSFISLPLLILSSCHLVHAAEKAIFDPLFFASPNLSTSRQASKPSSPLTSSQSANPSVPSSHPSPVSSYIRASIRKDSSGITGLGAGFDEFLDCTLKAEKDTLARLEHGSPEYCSARKHFTTIINAIANLQNRLPYGFAESPKLKDLMVGTTDATNNLGDKLVQKELFNERLRQENESLREVIDKAHEDIQLMMQQIVQAKQNMFEAKGHLEISSFLKDNDGICRYVELLQQKNDSFQLDFTIMSRTLERVRADYEVLEIENKEKSDRLVQLEMANALLKGDFEKLQEREKMATQKHMSQIIAQREIIAKLKSKLENVQETVTDWDEEKPFASAHIKSSTQHQRSRRHHIPDPDDIHQY